MFLYQKLNSIYKKRKCLPLNLYDQFFNQKLFDMMQPMSDTQSLDSQQNHSIHKSIVFPNFFNLRGLKVQDYVKLEHPQSNNSKKLRLPTEKELCQILITIQEQLPHCYIGEVIKQLYEQLIKAEQETRKKKESLLLQHEDDYLSDDESLSQLQKKRMQQQYARKFQNSDANPRFYEQREIAKLFCSKGYGYPTARQYLGDNITPNRYNNVITTIVRLSYRKLQYFIIKYIDPHLPAISREELKMIKTPLVNCRNWMSQRQSQNFHRFVKLTYKINTEDPERQIALELHKSIMDQLKLRNVTYKHHRRGQEYSGWTEEMEQNFIIHYLKNSNIIEIQRQLMLMYPNFRPCFQIGKLKLKIQRMIRLSAKKLNHDRQKFGITQVQNISDYLTNKFSRMANAEDVRKRLLKYYLDKDCNAMKVRWVFEMVVEYLRASKGEVQQIEDSSCEIIAKQELKAEQMKPDQKDHDLGLDLQKKEEE